MNLNKKRTITRFNFEVFPLAVLVGVFLLSAFALFYHYYATRQQLKNDFSQARVLTARYTAREISEYLSREQAEVLDIAGNLRLYGLSKGRQAIEIAYKSHHRSQKFHSFFIMDAKGRFLFSYPETLIDRYMQDLSAEPYFKEAKAGRLSFSPAIEDNKGAWSVYLSAPVVSEDGALLAVVSERIDVRSIEQEFIADLDAGPQTHAFLVDENGRMLANQTSESLYQIKASGAMLKEMLRGKEGVFETDATDGTGKEMTFISPMVFGGRPWSVGLVSSMDEVYSEASENLQRTIVIISLMTLAFAWSLVSVARSSRFKAMVDERTRYSEQLLMRNKELATLNELARVFGGTASLDKMIEQAVKVIKDGFGAKGAAVRLASPPHGDLVLKAHTGIPEAVAGRQVCTEVRRCVCGKVIQGGEAVFFNKNELDMLPDVPCGGKWEDNLARVPLQAKNKVLGVLYITGLGGYEYAEERDKFILAVGNQLAAGLENFLQMEDTKRHAARASALFHTAQALTKSLDLDELLRIIMKEAAALLKVRRCLLFLYSEERNTVGCRVALGFENFSPESLSFNPSGIFWEAMGESTVKVVDLRQRSYDLPNKFREMVDFYHFILVPLTSKGKVLGFLVLESGKNQAALDDLKLVMGFANQAAVAIETSSFYIRTVEKYNVDLQQLSNRILEAQEEERKRISRDLHDELGQVLTAIKINLDMLRLELPQDAEQPGTRVRDTVEMAVSALDSVRRLSFELRPSMLDDLGLSTVISKLVSDFRKRSGINVEYSEEGIEERLDPQFEVGLYRVVQEAFTNILKHAEAKNVFVTLAKIPEKGIVNLKIEDDGKGFEMADRDGTSPKGFGLLGIRERVVLMGGNFRIVSRKGAGTKLLVDIPLAKGEQDGGDGENTAG
jgi:signal transduction histidine kinase